MNKRNNIFSLALMAATILLLAACASIGRPEGGPKDELPPVYVKSDPAPGALNFNETELSIYFDENIKVEDVMNKVVVSPVQKTPPRVSANGKRLTILLQDTLVPNATYTIDCSDAIRDLNENNILDGFAFDFSTGDTRDSLVISGMLFEARNLEPAQGVIVGVYSNLEDSALTTLPMDRITKTNQYGQFVIRNLAEGTYNIFAINDINRDYHWDRSEDVAFYDTPIVPIIENIEVSDTLRAANGSDSIVVRNGWRYLPNDILLTWFNENYKSQYLRNNNRIDSTRIVFEFGAPVDTLPILTLLNTEFAGATLDSVSKVDRAAANDTLTYWLNNKQLVQSDTLIIEARYIKTDTLNQLSWTTDTLKLIDKSKPKQKNDKKKKEEKEEGDSIEAPELTFMNFSSTTRGSHDVNKPLRFVASQPVDTIYEKGLHLEMQVDTLWVDLGTPKVYRDSAHRLLNYRLDYDWEPGAKYRFTADSASIVGIYNEWIQNESTEFTIKNLEEYSTVTFNITGLESSQPLVVELLNTSDKPVATTVAKGGAAKFEFLAPNTYYARAFVDRNENGKWDTGNISTKTQPEEVYYFSKKLPLKKNWDLAQSWDLNELPIDAQKPYDIKKNKPKTKDRKQNNGEEDEDEYDEFNEEDEFYSPGSSQYSGYGNSQGYGNTQGGSFGRY